jgi:hypothetical protein
VPNGHRCHLNRHAKQQRPNGCRCYPDPRVVVREVERVPGDVNLREADRVQHDPNR